MQAVQCHMGWKQEQGILTVVAVIQVTEERKGVLAIGYPDYQPLQALGRGMKELLSKLLRNLPSTASLQWSMPTYSLLHPHIHPSFNQNLQRLLSAVSKAELTKGDKYTPIIEKTLKWSDTKLWKGNTYDTGVIVGTKLQEVEEFSPLQEKKKRISHSEAMNQVNMATLFHVPERYVAFDFETTAKHAQFARIIEIGAVKVDRGNVTQFHTFVNPQIKLPKNIRELTGIEQKQIEDAPFPWQAIRRFLTFIGDIPLLVGHNVTYDIQVLNQSCLRFKIPPWQGEYFCTQKYAKKVLVGLPDTKLNTVCEALQIQNVAPHRALADADASRLVFEELLGKQEPVPLQKIMG